MPHLSKAQLEPDVYVEIVEGLTWLLTNIKSETEMKPFIYDFFTKTERLMLAKRLAAAMMVTKGYETEVIVQVLKISTATVYRVHEWVDRGGGGLRIGLQKFSRREKLGRFWTRIDQLVETFISKPSHLPLIPMHA